MGMGYNCVWVATHMGFCRSGPHSGVGLISDQNTPILLALKSVLIYMRLGIVTHKGFYKN
jgi:hypothetical protein